MRALDLIQDCLRTQNPYLDLGRCGLTDDLVAEGTEIDLALRQCTHLKTLILSNNWYDWENGGRVYSPNTEKPNLFVSYLPALTVLKQLEVLRCGGEPGGGWQIKDMSFVVEMKALYLLDLSYNQLEELQGLDKLTQLQDLDVSANQISELKGLGNVTQLKKLYIHTNRISELQGLENLNNLQLLSISSNRISELKGLETLTQLQRFYIHNNEISELKGLEKLTQLQLLSISYNQLRELKGLETLTQLQELSVPYNQISELKGLEALTQLQTLDIAYNRISELEGLETLTQLQSLDISKNQLTKLQGVDTLINLQKLFIRSNQIVKLNRIDNLITLQKFDISHNQITDIRPLQSLMQDKKNPLQIVVKSWSLTNKGEINVADNPLTYPPVEIAKQGNAAILEYFAQLERTGLQRVREAKLILTGSGEVGKTSLRLRLKDKQAALPQADERTRKVEVDGYDFPTADGGTFQAHVWDFGGQQIIHHFHRFFMNEDALYLLMTETSRENDNFDYWLQNIQLFGKQSPILFVQNKRNGMPRSLSIHHYKAHFPIQEDLIEVNLLNNEGLERLEAAIQYHIQQLPITQRDIPTSWFRLREALEAEREQQPIISYERWVAMCGKEGIHDRQGISIVGEFLHKLGIILWYQDNATLREKIILRRHWATDGIFELIFQPSIQQTARFDKQTAQQLWDSCDNAADYSHHCAALVEMMCEFRICYPQRKQKDAYIIPALLPAQAVTLAWQYEPRLRVVYSYTFMPQGISNYLAAQLSKYIADDSHVWSEGFYLHKAKAQARIIENKYTNQLEIVIAGEAHQTWFGAIQEEIEEMHRSYAGIEPVLTIPCICPTCEALPLKERSQHKYETVLKRASVGSKRSTIECDISEEDVDARLLLDNLLPSYLQPNANKALEHIEREKRGINIHLNGNHNVLTIDSENNELNINSLSPETEAKIDEIHRSLSQLQVSILEKIGIESATIQAAIQNSSQTQLEKMNELLAEIDSETQEAIWEGLMHVAEHHLVIQDFIEKVENERKAQNLADSANLKLKLAIPLIPEVAAVEYEKVLVDGQTFSDLADGNLFLRWFMKWKGIV